MPPVVRSARELLRRPGGWVPATVVAAGGSLGVLLPLFELPGLELGLAVATLCTLFGGWTGATAAEDLRRVPRPSVPRIPSPGPGAAAAGAIGGATLVLWAAAAVPFLAAVLRAVLTTRCDPFAQAAFFPLLVLPAGFLAAAAGAFCRTAFPVRARAVALYVLLLLASVAWTVWPVVRGPQVFAFNFFLGMFPARSTTRRCGSPPRSSGSSWRRSSGRWRSGPAPPRSFRLPVPRTPGTGAVCSGRW